MVINVSMYALRHHIPDEVEGIEGVAVGHARLQAEELHVLVMLLQDFAPRHGRVGEPF